MARGGRRRRKMKDKKVWEGEYIALWESGYIGVSDGVGYVGEEKDLIGLYEALKKYFETKKETK